MHALAEFLIDFVQRVDIDGVDVVADHLLLRVFVDPGVLFHGGVHEDAVADLQQIERAGGAGDKRPLNVKTFTFSAIATGACTGSFALLLLLVVL